MGLGLGGGSRFGGEVGFGCGLRVCGWVSAMVGGGEWVEDTERVGVGASVCVCGTKAACRSGGRAEVRTYRSRVGKEICTLSDLYFVRRR